jgi:hypothetical protein
MIESVSSMIKIHGLMDMNRQLTKYMIKIV